MIIQHNLHYNINNNTQTWNTQNISYKRLKTYSVKTCTLVLNITTLTYGVKKSVLLHPPLHDYDHPACAAGGDNSNFQNSIISSTSRAPIIEALIGNLLQFKDSNRRKRQHILARRKAMCRCTPKLEFAYANKNIVSICTPLCQHEFEVHARDIRHTRPYFQTGIKPNFQASKKIKRPNCI